VNKCSLGVQQQGILVYRGIDVKRLEEHKGEAGGEKVVLADRHHLTQKN
jgi:hypothetical protein